MIHRTATHLVLTALLAMVAGTAWSAPADRKSVQFRGRITDERGAPLADATVTASGPHVLSSVANADGRYFLSLELGTVADLTKRSATWRIESKHKGKRVPVAGGLERLEFTVHVDTSGFVLVSSTLPSLGIQMSRDLSRSGAVVASVTLDFARARGARSDSAKAAGAIATSTTAKSPPSASGTAVAAAGAGAAATATVAPRKGKAAAPTAAEMLEASRQHGSLQAAEDAADSLRKVLREARRQEARLAEELEEARRDSTQRAARARKQAAAQSQAAQREQIRLLQAALSDSLRAVQRLRDSLDTVARDEQEARAAAQRDSARTAQRLRDSQRQVLRMEEIQRMIFRRDSATSAMRLRDSVNSVSRARKRTDDSLRAVARRDSIRAAQPKLVLDPRPPVGGKLVGAPPAAAAATVREPDKAAAADDAGAAAEATPATPCECRVRGTIEVRSEKPLASPLSVQVGVKGQKDKKASVQLFMGSPRGFVFTHVPCGAVELEVTIPTGRRFAVSDAQALGPSTCVRNGQWQPRVVLVPN